MKNQKVNLCIMNQGLQIRYALLQVQLLLQYNTDFKINKLAVHLNINYDTKHEKELLIFCCLYLFASFQRVRYSRAIGNFVTDNFVTDNFVADHRLVWYPNSNTPVTGMNTILGFLIDWLTGLSGPSLIGRFLSHLARFWLIDQTIHFRNLVPRSPK